LVTFFVGWLKAGGIFTFWLSRVVSGEEPPCPPDPTELVAAAGTVFVTFDEQAPIEQQKRIVIRRTPVVCFLLRI